MIRFFFVILSVIVLAPCVLWLCVWCAGKNHGTHWSRTEAGSNYPTESIAVDANARGLWITYGLYLGPAKLGPLTLPLEAYHRPTEYRSTHSALGFGILLQRTGVVADRMWKMWRIWMPTWFLAVSMGGLATFAIRYAAWRRMRTRLARNACSICGYDLRATPDRCPECGMVPKPTIASNTAPK